MSLIFPTQTPISKKFKFITIYKVWQTSNMFTFQPQGMSCETIHGSSVKNLGPIWFPFFFSFSLKIENITRNVFDTNFLKMFPRNIF